MSRRILAAAIAASLSVAVSVPAVAGDYTQLARSAGLQAADAGAKSLDEIVALKFSKEGRENQQSFVARMVDASPAVAVRSSRAAAGSSLDARHLSMINAGVSGQERQIARSDAVYDNPQARRRLAASAGISADQADGMTLAAIAERKFYKELDGRK